MARATPSSSVFRAPRTPGGSVSFPGHGSSPAVDDRIVTPDTRAEILQGHLVWAAPADEPHGNRHFDLAFVLGAYVAPGYLGAVEMLTRTARDDDFAPDASIYPEARDPATGGRLLEELAFEVTDKQALRVPTEKARELARRGVRRVFAVLVKQKRVVEWSTEVDGWASMDVDAVIADRCLVRPLPIQALLDASSRDAAVARALLERGNPVIEAALGEREARGEARGALHASASTLLDVLSARGVAVSEAARLRVESCADPSLLQRWTRRAATATHEDEVFGRDP